MNEIISSIALAVPSTLHIYATIIVRDMFDNQTSPNELETYLESMFHALKARIMFYNPNFTPRDLNKGQKTRK